MLSWGEAARVPAAVLLTKADKLSRSAGIARCREIGAVLAADTPLLLFSATSRQGVQQARAQLVAWLGLESPAIA